MTRKRRVAITDPYGEHVAAVYVPDSTVDFEEATLESFVVPGVTMLRGRSFRKAMMYWAVMSGADLSGCNFEGADLRGANLNDTLLVGANLRRANLGVDNLGGGASLCGANLSDAALEGTILSDARFDARTVFPVGFDPIGAGMIESDAS